MSRVSLLVAALLAVAALASAVIATRIDPIVAWLDIGSPGDEAYVTAFYPPESNSDETFRWMAGEAALRVPVGRPGAYRLDLDIATVRAEGRTLQVTCGAHSYSLPLVEVGADSTVPIRCDTGSDAILLEFQTEPVRLPEGGRALGVSFLDVRVTALDSGDRLLFRVAAGLTVFGAALGASLAAAALGRRRWWLGVPVGAGVLLAWTALVMVRPEYAPSTVAGPGGVMALLAGLAAWLLARGRRGQPLALAGAAVLTGLLWAQPAATRALPAIWAREELDALRMLPWLAVFGLVCAALLGGRRAAWLASAAALLAAGACFLTPITARAGERWLIEVDAPDWTNRAGIAGALYVLVAFLLAALALLAARQSDSPRLWRFMVAGGLAIAALLLWRIEIMLFNGDEPHYYVTSRSIATDRDLELLDDYLDPHYAGITYSPVGNVAAERDSSIFRYAGAAPPAEGAWFLIPPLPDGWSTSDGASGLLPATGEAPRITGPDGGLAIPSSLTPGPAKAIILEGPCMVDEVTVGVPSGERREVRVSVLDASGAILWETTTETTAPLQSVAIPASAGLCRGTGPWTVRVDAADGEIVAVALDHYRGLQFSGGDLQHSWVFGGLPRDRYGSVDVDARLLLHNPSAETIQATIRQITVSDMTVSEITVGIAPGQTLVEALPIFGANAVSVLVTQDVQIAAGLYGIVEGTRYRMPPAWPADTLQLTIPADGKYDSGVWLTVFNASWMIDQIVIDDGQSQQTLDVCSNCAAVQLLEAGNRERSVSIRSASGEPRIYALVAYQERTGALHFDLPLPLAAAPLAGFDAAWPVLFVPALAGLALLPALAYLLAGVGLDRRTALTMAALFLLLAPFSTYAVRFYTEIVAAALILWGLVLWERAFKSNRALAGLLAIAVFLPLLHGRLTLLGAGLLALAIYAAILHNRDRIGRPTGRQALLFGLGLIVAVGLAALVLLQFTVSLESRDVAKFFRLTWVLPNSVGMLVDRGSGVLPFAPWALFALAVPRPLQRTQRAALALAISYYALLALRAGGWQTWGSPMRYLLPVIGLVAFLAIPGLVAWWRSGQAWRRAAAGLALAWSLGATMLLHWIPLSGYVERRMTGNVYLIDDALAWLPFPSPFRYMPAIEALSGPEWSEPLGIAITLGFAAAALWVAWPLLIELARPNRATAEQARRPGDAG